MKKRVSLRISLALAFCGIFFVPNIAKAENEPLPGKTLCIVTAKKKLHDKWTDGDVVGKYDVDGVAAGESLQTVINSETVLDELDKYKGYSVFYECMSEQGVAGKRIDLALPTVKQTKCTPNVLNGRWTGDCSQNIERGQVPIEIRPFVSLGIAAGILGGHEWYGTTTTRMCLPETFNTDDVAILAEKEIEAFASFGSGDVADISVSVIEILQKKYPCPRDLPLRRLRSFRSDNFPASMQPFVVSGMASAILSEHSWYKQFGGSSLSKFCPPSTYTVGDIAKIIEEKIDEASRQHKNIDLSHISTLVHYELRRRLPCK